MEDAGFTSAFHFNGWKVISPRMNDGLNHRNFYGVDRLIFFMNRTAKRTSGVVTGIDVDLIEQGTPNPHLKGFYFFRPDRTLGRMTSEWLGLEPDAAWLPYKVAVVTLAVIMLLGLFILRKVPDTDRGRPHAG